MNDTRRTRPDRHNLEDEHMASFTPGPWEMSTLDSRTIGPVRTIVIEDEGGWTRTPIPQLQAVAVVKEWTGETEANARLIAAAPELLAACEAAQELIGATGRGSETTVYRQLTAAIAKARGL